MWVFVLWFSDGICFVFMYVVCKNMNHLKSGQYMNSSFAEPITIIILTNNLFIILNMIMNKKFSIIRNTISSVFPIFNFLVLMFSSIYTSRALNSVEITFSASSGESFQIIFRIMTVLFSISRLRMRIDVLLFLV